MNRLSKILGDRAAQATEIRDRSGSVWIGQWLIWCGPGLMSGLMLWLSFPPVGWSWLAWVALVPLATLIRAPWRSQPIYRAAWAGGMVFGLLAVQWIRYADDSGLSGYYGMAGLAFYLSLYFPLFLLAARVAILRFHVPAIIAVPTIWTGLEYFRSWFLSGFPWYFLSHSQYRRIGLIQISDLVGAYGVSFVVALGNGWLLDVLTVTPMRSSPTGSRLAPEQVWRLGLVLAVTAASLGYGSVRLRQADEHRTIGPRVALIQTNIPQQVKSDESQTPAIHRQYLKLLDEAAASRPQLIIWPETAYRIPLVMIGPDVTDEDLTRLYAEEAIDPKRIRQVADDVREDLTFLAKRAGASMLMGLNSEVVDRSNARRFNTAVLVELDGKLSPPYHKIHLVPWGEYLPLSKWLPWLHFLTPHASANYGIDSGAEAVRFRWNGYSFGVLICFEDTLPWAARVYAGTDPVDILVNISNDGWFGVCNDDEASVGLLRRAQHEAHLAISVFRAVECRRPLVRAVNTGISAIIDSSGRIVRATGDETGKPELASDVVTGEIPLDDRESLYVRSGDWLAILCLVTTVALLCARAAMSIRRVSRSPS